MAERACVTRGRVRSDARSASGLVRTTVPFSADLAHELRSPINNLMGMGEAQVALSHERSAAEYARVLHSALEEHGRLARMIDSMLFLAQADQARAVFSLAPLDAGAELRKVAEFYQALADEQAWSSPVRGTARSLPIRCSVGMPSHTRQK